MLFVNVAAIFLATCLQAAAQNIKSNCKKTVSSNRPAPSVAAGYEVHVVSSGLQSPRGIIFDSSGHLLVVQQNQNIVALTLDDNGGGCVTEKGRKVVIDDNTLNHGIELSPDGKTLYASSPEAVYSYGYRPKTASNSSVGELLIDKMTTSDHTTRTLLLSKKMPGYLLVSRGSTSNIDTQALVLATGHSQIRAFNLNNRTGTYDYSSSGLRLGWGLRNDVGMAEHPISGGIYSVENSVDQMVRDGQDIHENNPGEEMNFLGYLQAGKPSSPNQGGNFGYPNCFAAWDVSSIPDQSNLTVGMQFAIGNANSTVNDHICQTQMIAPRLTFQAHMAPLDIKFNPMGDEAYITFHGSWDRTDPAGYKVSMVGFTKDGQPTAPSTSNTALFDIVSNPDNSKCPDGCFRPVGLAFDRSGRLYFSSDASGEIYVITRTASGSLNGPMPSTTTAASTSTTTGDASSYVGKSLGIAMLLASTVALLLI